VAASKSRSGLPTSTRPKVSDVVLAAVASGLRELLASRGEDVERLVRLFSLLFAATYFVMDSISVRNFSEPLRRTDA
jgi:hypothetical protein